MSLSTLLRTLLAMLLTGAAVLGPASVAVAQEVCYPPPCAPGITDSTVVPGQTVTVSSGTGSYEPGESVEYGVESVYQRLGQTTANANGAAVVTFRMPDLPIGRHSVVFTSLVDGDQVRVPFTVSSAAAARARAAVSPSVGWLPRTGSAELVLLAAAGAGLFATGTGVLLSVRRRRGRLV